MPTKICLNAYTNILKLSFWNMMYFFQKWPPFLEYYVLFQKWPPFLEYYVLFQNCLQFLEYDILFKIAIEIKERTEGVGPGTIQRGVERP